MEEAVRRLAADVARIVGADNAAQDSIGIAVSGGPDSLALLLLAAQAFPDRIAAATVDHGLRPESADEAAFVAALCRDLGVPHHILSPAEPITGNLQSAARSVRYALLDQWAQTHGLSWVATAHHADDQVETLVMRLQRGAGLSGLASIRRCNGHSIRPLLNWRRADLQRIVDAAGLVAVDDPSNRDPRFDRAALRKLLTGLSWLDVAAWSSSAAHLSEAEQALQWMTARLFSERYIDGTLDLGGLPTDLRRRLLLKAFDEHGETAPRGAALARAMALIEGGKTAMLGDTLLQPDGTLLRFTAAPTRRTVQPNA